MLVDLHRRKDEFLAMLSHELRSPLAPISNAVQLLRLQTNEDPLQQQARNIIERQVGQLTHLVDDLLEVARITTGRVQLRQERITVSGVVERAVGTARPLVVLGKGSEFVVRLPVVLIPTLASPSPSTETAQPAGKGCRVLAVDDNVDAAEILAMLLEASGHDVRMAHDGPTALEAALDYRPDVVLLDIGLPGLDGFEAAKRIRQHPTLKSIVLVAMTGYGQKTDRQRSQEAGFDHHLVKPADFGEVQKILATVANKAM